jgi:hypothetical protein
MELKVSDRCDRCGAQAFVLVRGVNGELLFCGHHYAENEKKLADFAFDIVDERDKINSKPSPASEFTEA